MKYFVQLSVLGLAAGWMSTPLYAAFEVVEETRPKSVCGTYVVEEPNCGPYGNGQGVAFHRAIDGAGPLTPEEQERLALVLPVRDVNVYYGRFAVNFSTLIFSSIKNRSSGIDMLGATNVKRSSRNQPGLEIAVGYMWSRNFRGEIEYLVNRNLNYNANPALIGVGVPARQLTSTIKNNTLLANVYYEFDGLYRFRPYVTGGIGVAANSIQSSVTPSPGSTNITASKTTQSVRAAYALGAGMRVGMFSRWYLDFNYRYFWLGNKLAINPVTNYKLTGNYTMSAVSIGLIYIF